MLIEKKPKDVCRFGDLTGLSDYWKFSPPDDKTEFATERERRLLCSLSVCRVAFLPSRPLPSLPPLDVLVGCQPRSSVGLSAQGRESETHLPIGPCQRKDSDRPGPPTKQPRAWALRIRLEASYQLVHHHLWYEKRHTNYKKDLGWIRMEQVQCVFLHEDPFLSAEKFSFFSLGRTPNIYHIKLSVYWFDIIMNGNICSCTFKIRKKFDVPQISKTYICHFWIDGVPILMFSSYRSVFGTNVQSSSIVL